MKTVFKECSPQEESNVQNKSFEVILSHFNGNYHLFDEYWVNREEWAKVLGVKCRQTIWNWEREIIQGVFVIFLDYQNTEPGNQLDDYQRAILALISLHTKGKFDGKHRRWKGVTNWLVKNAEYFRREQFINWINVYKARSN